MSLLDQVTQTYHEAMQWWCAHNRDEELVEEIADVALESAESGEWDRAVRAAKACAREAEDCLGYPDAGWESFRTAVTNAAGTVEAAQKHCPMPLQPKRTIPAMPHAE